MALSQSVASELLEAFRAGEGVDLVRESVRLVMQELIETEATEVVGAGRYERSEGRTTQRNAAPDHADEAHHPLRLDGGGRTERGLAGEGGRGEGAAHVEDQG